MLGVLTSRYMPAEAAKTGDAGQCLFATLQTRRTRSMATKFLADYHPWDENFSRGTAPEIGTVNGLSEELGGPIGDCYRKARKRARPPG